MRYPVRITPDDDQFTVTFPDVPEAITFGETRQEALEHAPHALLTIFDAFMKDRRPIPAPSATMGEAIELPALDTAKIELYRAMLAADVGKAELARRLHWHMPQVDRVLDVHHASKIDQMEAALRAVGKRLRITVEDASTPSIRTRATAVPLRMKAAPGKKVRRTKTAGRIPNVSAAAFTRGRSGYERVGRAVTRKAVKKR
jgi:antitoxin HicB